MSRDESFRTRVQAGLPQGWLNVQLDSVARRGSGHTPDKKRPGYWGGSISWVSLKDTIRLDRGVISSTAESITDLGLSHSSAVVHPEGSVVLLRDAAIGKSGILGSAMAVSQHFMSWTCGPKLHNWFLYYLFQIRRGDFERVSNGSTIKTIGLDFFKQLTIPLPPLSEQLLVAEVLRDADAAITTLEHVITKKNAIMQGMMQQLLTGRTRLPGFGAAWDKVRLGEHVAYVKTVPLSHAQLDLTSPIKCLHYGAIHKNSRIFLNAAATEMPRAATELARAAGLLRVGDLIFADASEDPIGVGKSVELTSVPTTGVVPGLHTIAARFDKAVLADGFKGYLQFIPAFRQALLRLAAGTKVLATTRSYISSITLSLPSLDEQRAIAAALTDCEREMEVLTRRLAKSRAIKHGMMQQLLTGKTRLPVEATS